MKVIDYDRLTLGGGADYYVSFDNVAGRQAPGPGSRRVPAGDRRSAKPVVAELNGAPTDNNATLFAQGYNSVLNPLYASGTLAKGPNQSVPNWDNQQALTIFEQMLTETSNKIDGVLAANDGLANSVVSAINTRKLQAVPGHRPGRYGAGIQHILAGQQCMTVYKAVKQEAAAAAAAAISLVKGRTPVDQRQRAQRTRQDDVRRCC